MAAYNPHNFDFVHFMNDFFLQPDLSAQFQFLRHHLQVVNAYASNLEQVLNRVRSALGATTPAQPGTLEAAPTNGTSKKVEMFVDLGNFNREINYFEKWWLKMKTWLNISQQTISLQSYDVVVAILLQMSQKAGIFSP
jgi:hypothetical protein